MILKRYINREILRTSVGILMVLVLIFISSRFINYIQLAVDGTISSAAVFQLVALEIPSVTGFLLPLSFFIATMIVLGRLYSENEMAVIKSAGVSDFQLAKNILSLAVILAIVAALLSLWVNPWAKQTSQMIKAEEQVKANLGIFFPGRFKENKEKSGVLFVESKNDDGKINHLFAVSGLNEGSTRINIEVAASGKLAKGSEIAGDDANDLKGYASEEADFLILQNGTSYVLNLDNNQWQTTQYEEYFMRLEEKEVPTKELTTKALSTSELLRIGGADEYAELHWRLSAAISIVILCFIALPLARAQPRKDKFSRLFPGVMSYMVYALMLLNGRTLIENGKVPTEIGFWWIHASAIMFCLLIYKFPFNSNKRRKANV